MKICNCCKKEKPLSEFNLRTDTGTYRKKCKHCNSISNKWKNAEKRKNPEFKAKELERVRDWYAKKRKDSKFIEKQRDRNAKALLKTKLQCIELKGGKCLECGYDKCIAALEFHHLDPNKKEFSIASKTRFVLTEKIKTELDKCILLCANCHRELHYKEL